MNRMQPKFAILSLIVTGMTLSLTGCGGDDAVTPAQSSDRDVEAEQKLAEKRSNFDWQAWRAMPVLDDGRIKPIDTVARETCVLVTAGRTWTDPVTDIKYPAYELLLAWMAEPDVWAKRPVLRCEFRPLRELLQYEFIQEATLELEATSDGFVSKPLEHESIEADTVAVVLYEGEQPIAQLTIDQPEEGQADYQVRAVGASAVPKSWSYDAEERVVKLEWSDPPASDLKAAVDYEYRRADLPENGLYVAANDIIDWDALREEGREVFRSRRLRKQLANIMQQQRNEEQGLAEDSDQLDEETKAQNRKDQALNNKVMELYNHLRHFTTAIAGEKLAVVPSIDPKVLTRPFNTSDVLDAWVTLDKLRRVNRDRFGVNPNPTVAAVIAESPADLADMLLMAGLDRQLRSERGSDLSFTQLKQQLDEIVRAGYFKEPTYEADNIAQLAVALEYQDSLRPKLMDVDPAFEEMCAAYRNGDGTKFEDASQSFARSLRALGEALDKTRFKMEPPEKNSIDFGKFSAVVWGSYEELELSDRQMARASYPAADATDLEMKYNESNPFQRAWILFFLVGIIGWVSYVVRGRKWVYSTSLVFALVAIIYSAYGFTMRVQISGWAPVTNMYETVIWVGFIVALMGWVFSLTPLFGPVMSRAWRMTGLPLKLRRDETGRINGIRFDEVRTESERKRISDVLLPLIQAVSTLAVVSVFSVLMYVMTSSGTSFEVISWTPKTDADMAWTEVPVSRLMTWVVGMVTCLLSAWFVPRVVLTLSYAVALFPFDMRAVEDWDRIWDRLFSRRFFMVPAMFVACFAMALAHFVGNVNPDILNPEIGSVSAVLRNRYWLFVHVLTIVSSYGAGALAWGLGNVALCYYLFGRYSSDSARVSGKSGDTLMSRLRNAGVHLKPGKLKSTLATGFRNSEGDAALVDRRRPPREVTTLASYNYRVMQVATLLLATGTILGGLWADVSWGRFWDWDPKEVWALISLLAYLVVLHGRFAGWCGPLGTNAGSVVCFMAIIGSWYGVNFLLPKFAGWYKGTGRAEEVGLHSYASGGEDGWLWVVGAMGVNLVFVMWALGRYAFETSQSADASGTPGAAETQDVAEPSAV